MDANGHVDGNLSVGEDALGRINAAMPPSMVNSGAHQPGPTNLQLDGGPVDMAIGPILAEDGHQA
jgi:hypothetical protein